MKYLWILVAALLAAVLFLLLRRKSSKQVLAGEAEAKEAFLENVKRFAGCFRPLLEAAQDASLSDKHLEVWQKRMQDLPPLDDYFRALRASCQNASDSTQRWVQTLERWGIQHDAPGSVFCITEAHETLYLFDDIYPEGAEAKVVQPAWWLQAGGHLICLELGTAEIQ